MRSISHGHTSCENLSSAAIDVLRTPPSGYLHHWIIALLVPAKYNNPRIVLKNRYNTGINWIVCACITTFSRDRK